MVATSKVARCSLALVQRVYRLTQRSDWPAPYEVLIQGRMWWRADIEDWIERHRPNMDDMTR